jgi:hypothetical protein
MLITMEINQDQLKFQFFLFILRNKSDLCRPFFIPHRAGYSSCEKGTDINP